MIASKRTKNFFYRINPNEVLGEAIFQEDKEQWFLQFFNDLRNDDPENTKTDLAKEIIIEAHAFREKRSIAGKASAAQKHNKKKRKATNVEHMLDTCLEVLQQNSTNSSSSKATAKKPYAENVSMTESEYQKLVESHGQDKTDWMVRKLDNAKGANSKLKYTSDYRAILKWVVDCADKEFKPKESDWRNTYLAGY